MMYKVKLAESWARITWCEQQFGDTVDYGHAWVKGARWWRIKGYLYFRDEKDYLFYLLRWS